MSDLQRSEAAFGQGKIVGVIASTPLVESLYVQLLSQATLPGAMSLGLSGAVSRPERFGSILLVLDSAAAREAAIARCAAVKGRGVARIICIYDAELADVIRWARTLDVFVFLRASAPFGVIASAVTLASYMDGNAANLRAADRENVTTDGGTRDVAKTHLTARQLDVLRLLAKGYSNKAMAHSLVLSEPTVKLHLASLRRIFNATNRTEVLVKALRLGAFPL